MSKVAIITNIPSPYRVDLFYYLQTQVKEHHFTIIYTSRNEDNRAWNVSEEKLLNSCILNAKILKIKSKLDTRYIHLPGNVGKVLGEINPDVVIASEYNPAALQALFWAQTHKKKFIHWTDGTLHSERNIGKVQKLSRKIICSNADVCIASSTKAKEKLLAWGVPEEKIFISLLTVDITQFADNACLPDDNNPSILYVGSFIKRKGLDLLLEALPHVEKNVELRIVGNGTQEEIENLKKLARQLKIYERVTFCGYKSGALLAEEYSRANLFVLPTREDCFGLVLLEAFCAKRPIVASKYADGAYDIVVDGYNGFIVDPFDEKQLAGAIDKAMNREIFENASQNDSTKFEFENVAKAFVWAVESVV